MAGLQGELIEKKSLQGSQHKREPINQLAKVAGYVVIILLDLFMLLYILLFALNQTGERQSAWLYSFLIWLALEVFVVSTLVMIMSEFIVPSILFRDVKHIKNKIIDAVNAYKEKKLVTNKEYRLSNSSESNLNHPY